ncbi:MAG: hypothetical protein RLN62_01810 [Rickettsiales bacterium]
MSSGDKKGKVETKEPKGLGLDKPCKIVFNAGNVFKTWDNGAVVSGGVLEFRHCDEHEKATIMGTKGFAMSSLFGPEHD